MIIYTIIESDNFKVTEGYDSNNETEEEFPVVFISKAIEEFPEIEVIGAIKGTTDYTKQWVIFK